MAKIDKSKLKIRWVVLVLTCVLMVGNYFVYDNPSALKSQLEDRMGKDNYEEYFALTYTVYSIPNVVLPFFGGYFVDKIGARVMLLLFGGLILAGQCVFAMGVSAKSWPLILVGRTIFGFGGESLTVGQSTLVAEWFKGKELALALGINLSIARLGSVINNGVTPYLARVSSVTFAVWFGAFVCIVSIVATLLLIPIDTIVEKQQKQQDADNINGAESDEPTEVIELGAVKHFRKGFWLLTGSCLLVYGCVLPFNNIESAYLQKRDYFTDDDCSLPQWSTDAYCIADLAGDDPDCSSSAYKNTDYCEEKADAETKAGEVMSIPYIISAVSSPFLGYAVDRFGKRATTAIVAPAMFLLVHMMLGQTSITPIVPLLILGAGYSAFGAALWPSVPYTVEEIEVGTAYGVITAVQNCGLALFPILISVLADHDPTYTDVEWFFSGVALCGVVVGVLLLMDDKKNGDVLELPSFTAESDSDVVDKNDVEEPLIGSS